MRKSVEHYIPQKKLIKLHSYAPFNSIGDRPQRQMHIIKRHKIVVNALLLRTILENNLGNYQQTKKKFT